VVVALVVGVGFWMNLSDRTSKAHSAAESAVQVAAEAEQAIQGCRTAMRVRVGSSRAHLDTRLAFFIVSRASDREVRQHSEVEKSSPRNNSREKSRIEQRCEDCPAGFA
jgi:hypothetical protein